MAYTPFIVKRQQLPTSLTPVVSSSGFIDQIRIYNQSGTNTMTLQDGNGVPIFPTSVMYPGSWYTDGIMGDVDGGKAPMGLPIEGGMSWASSGTGMYGIIIGHFT